MDINEKLRKLTPEQAKALGASLNSVYIEAEKANQQKEAHASNKEKPSAARESQ